MVGLNLGRGVLLFNKRLEVFPIACHIEFQMPESTLKKH